MNPIFGQIIKLIVYKGLTNFPFLPYDKQYTLIYSPKGSSFYNNVVITELHTLGVVGNISLLARPYLMVKVYFLLKNLYQNG